MAKVTRTDNETIVDVRDDLREGREPFGDIMKALQETPQGHTFVLLATFLPEPLIALLGDQGYKSEAVELPGGEWRVAFRRETTEG